MKKFIETAGIDISKLTIDVYLHQMRIHRQFANNKTGFKMLLKWICSLKLNPREVLFCFEHTGWYCILLSYYLHDRELDYCCINPIEIKRSIGLKRNKTDKDDAQNIAHYAWLRRDELKASTPPPVKIIELQRMMSLREQLVKQSTALKNLRKGMEQLVSSPSTDVSVSSLDQTLQYLKKQVLRIEKEMEKLINSDESMGKNYKLSRTVKGVGTVLAVQMLLHTHNYSRFNSWRQFSSYCGLVPCQYQSGTSIHGRSRGHPISDRKMKSLLSMAAISAVQWDQELKEYYQSRVEKGKPKMLVLNIIRNKLVSRIFATVKRGTAYVEIKMIAA